MFCVLYDIKFSCNESTSWTGFVRETNTYESLPEGMKKYRITASIVGTSITLVSSPQSSSARRRIMSGENCEREPVG